ncbi:lipopolysaccharide assembly LapA domain-containing protein [Paenibacillus sp. NPDC058071]|uniref:LapA family protein n=1 Tax=Paenibacillus sp. NPDC058071 TaxID=3346326 RepID=UPI0036DF60EA
MKGQSLLISGLVFAFVIAWFAVINVDKVQVNFMFTKTQIPLILVILASTLFGGVTAFLFGFIRQFRLQRTVKTLEKKIAELSSPPAAEAFYEEAAPGSASAEQHTAER